MHSNNLDDMLNKGFSRKFALYYLQQLEEENESSFFDKNYLEWSHSMGFLAHNACTYDLKPENINNYLSDYDYYKIWPVNSWSRIWIDDKLTLKYILSGTEFNDMMPEYYYYSTQGGLRILMNNHGWSQDINGLLELLKAKKKLACKPNNSSGSQGFVKLSFTLNERFFINEKPASEADVEDFVITHSNYIFTEYLEPGEPFRSIHPQIHTLRLVVINEHGNDPYVAAAYLRFPNRESGSANYNSSFDNGRYNLVSCIDPDSGFIGETKMIFASHTVPVKVHPDTGVEISTCISVYESGLRERVLGIARLLSNVEYMGFDIGITGSGAKIMEINSHPGIGYLQCFKGFYTDERLGKFFKSKLQK